MSPSSLTDNAGIYQAAYAVVTLAETVEANRFPKGFAELIALTRGLHVAKGLQVNIYIRVAHSHSVLWMQRGFITTKE